LYLGDEEHDHEEVDMFTEYRPCLYDGIYAE
jgi:hypothetical protein